MLGILYPHEYVDSVFSINYPKLLELGYKGVIFDIDNTLVHHGEDGTPEIASLIQSIHSFGIKTLLLTNNTENRVLRFLNTSIETLYIHEAGKPNPSNYLKALELMGLELNEVVFVGDQIFTDIYGANRAGIKNILVKFLRNDHEKKIGLRRQAEKIILWTYALNQRYQHRLGDIVKYVPKGDSELHVRKRKLFSEMNPLFHAISTQKEIYKRHLVDLFRGERFFSHRTEAPLTNKVSSYQTCMIKKGPGILIEHQTNKVINIGLACSCINGAIIHPGESFSFWKAVGKMTTKKGYKKGRVIVNKKLVSGIGGGLCNLANAIHLLILHSPMDVMEFHKHSDALAPDEGKRVPFSSGTSVSYNHVDYRFKNTTNQAVQLLCRCEGDILHVELRSDLEFPWCYEIVEENHHFKEVSGKYYRKSHIFRNVTQRSTGVLLKKELVLYNVSEVMYDYSLIPKDQIKI